MVRLVPGDGGPGFIQNGAGGSLTGVAIFRNVSARPCSLLGHPHVRFVGGGAAKVRQTERPIAAAGGEPPLPPRAWLRALAPRREASVAVWWRNWCGPGSPPASGPFTPPTAVVISLPHGGGRVRMPIGGAPRCDDPQSPSAVGVEPFVLVLPKPSPWTHLRLQADILGGTLYARRGSLLQYRVRLRNVSSRTLRFGRCPLLVEELAPANRAQVYVLNCRPIGSLPPGDAAVFTMELHLSPRTPLGANGLFWELDPGSSYEPSADATVVVRR